MNLYLELWVGHWNTRNLIVCQLWGEKSKFDFFNLPDLEIFFVFYDSKWKVNDVWTCFACQRKYEINLNNKKIKCCYNYELISQSKLFFSRIEKSFHRCLHVVHFWCNMAQKYKHLFGSINTRYSLFTINILLSKRSDEMSCSSTLCLVIFSYVMSNFRMRTWWMSCSSPTSVSTLSMFLLSHPKLHVYLKQKWCQTHSKTS